MTTEKKKSPKNAGVEGIQSTLNGPDIAWVDRETSVLGYDVVYKMPASSVDFNKLDPKRADAANDEACSNVMYRTMNPWTRDWFLHGRGKDDAEKLGLEQTVGFEDQVVEMIGEGPFDVPNVEEEYQKFSRRGTKEAKDKNGKVRMKDGEPVTTYVESQDSYSKRALSLLVFAKKFASEDAARAHFLPQIRKLALEVVCDPSQREVGERGPKKLKAAYKIAAAKSLALGTWSKLNTNMFAKIGKVFEPTNDSSVMFNGKYPTKDTHGKESEVEFSVSDKDAEKLGWLIREYQDWKSAQELAEFPEA